MEILNLLLISSVPVIKVLMITGLGAFLAMKKIDILGAEARKHLNKVIFYVFNPALVSTNLSKTVTFESIMLLWFMPVNILFTCVIGIALGWILVKITKPPIQLKGLILGCCSAGNLGNLLLIVIPAICQEKGSPFGDPNVCGTYGLAYASLSMALGAIFLWSIAYNIMLISFGKSTGGEEPIDGPKSHMRFYGANQIIVPSETTEALLASNKALEQSPVTLPEFEDSADRKDSIFMRLTSSLKMIFSRMQLKRLLTPSTIGVAVGFIVGVVPQLRTSMVGESAPLRVVQDSAELLGEGAIPAVTLIMGGNLTKGTNPSGMPKSLILGVILIRYLLMPITGVFIVKGAINLGLVHSDPLYQFILYIQYAVPPAMNLGTITQLFGCSENESSVILLWTYILASISITLWSTFFLWLVA